MWKFWKHLTLGLNYTLLTLCHVHHSIHSALLRLVNTCLTLHSILLTLHHTCLTLHHTLLTPMFLLSLCYSRSPGGTPSTGWHGGRRKGQCEPGLAPLFNHLLLQKFANARTPSPHGSRMASPGSFDSPSGTTNENCNP